MVQKVADRRITNSKDLRKLRQVLADPVADAMLLCGAERRVGRENARRHRSAQA
ncbi:hypothetical protein IVB12_16335 [Bradyrhizobium sp. 179]|uniref:hypothetical protein n=1 Tax=Bradyrhizobium sp. 179 TaxID=2782648 RepID=UPI001FF7BDC6|nr:hypothetical protein [Bradyrhizobium sp. 179]MCK1543483.1 hypothetical protein [Bradyrhizobium sp. 179]